MRLKNEFYDITVSIDPTYTLYSADNVIQYDRVLIARGLERGDHYTAYRIKVIAGEREYSIALIGGDNCDDSECAVLEGDVLTVLQNQFITGIDLVNCSIVNSKKLSGSCVNYALFKIKGGMAVIGELDITGLDSEYNVVWRYGSLDIITDFEILEDRIEYSDCLGHEYVLWFEKDRKFSRRDDAEGRS